MAWWKDLRLDRQLPADLVGWGVVGSDCSTSESADSRKALGAKGGRAVLICLMNSLKIRTHLGGVAVLIVTMITGIAIWIAVQSGRSDPLPTLVWSPKLDDRVVMDLSPRVLDRLGNGWWWVVATPTDRERLRQAGASIAMAFPTPLAQMAGCSI